MPFTNDYAEREFMINVELLQQYYAACDAENEVVPDIEKAIEDFFQVEMTKMINVDNQNRGYHEFLKSNVKGYPWYQFDKFPVVRAEALIGNPNLYKIGCPANPPALNDIANKMRAYMNDYNERKMNIDEMWKKYHNHKQPKGLKEFLKATREYYGEHDFISNSGSNALLTCAKSYGIYRGEPYKSHPEKLPAYLDAITAFLAANTDWEIERKFDGVYVDGNKLIEVYSLYGFSRESKRDTFGMYDIDITVALEDPDIKALGYGDNFAIMKSLEHFKTEYGNLPQSEVEDLCADYTYEPYGFARGFVYGQWHTYVENGQDKRAMWKDVDMDLYNQCIEARKKAGYHDHPELKFD